MLRYFQDASLAFLSLVVHEETGDKILVISESYNNSGGLKHFTTGSQI